MKHPSLFAATPPKKTMYEDGEPVKLPHSGPREVDLLKPRPKDLTDVELESCFKQLEQKRMEWAKQGVGAEGNNFNIRMLKGLWTLQHKGVAFDAAQGYTSGKDASTFCEVASPDRHEVFNRRLWGACSHHSG